MKSKQSKLRRFFSRRHPALIAGLLLVVLAAGLIYYVTRPVIREDAGLTQVGDIPVYTDLLPEGVRARPGVKRVIKYLVIHETDNFSAEADAAAHDSFIHQNGQTQPLSWHYTVDDHQIYHHLPDDEAGYHASDGLNKNGGNLNGIGIEMCVNADGDYEKTLENTVQLCAVLLDTYKLKPSALRKHQDFCGKVCPAKLIGSGRWDEFCDRVESAYLARRAAE